MARILARCSTLHSIYWPTLFAPGAVMQMLLLGAKTIRTHCLALFRPNYPYSRRSMLPLADGEVVALDWLETPQTSTPVVVLLHGAFQASESPTMGDLALSLARRGYTSVVFNRRGYGGMPLRAEPPRLALFGFDEDLDEVLAHVAVEKGRQRGVALVGFSCGSGYAGRYLGERGRALSPWPEDAELARPDLPRLVCGVAYDPGYTVHTEADDAAAARIPPPFSWAMNVGIKWFYVYRHRKRLAARSPSSPALVRQLLRLDSGFRETFKLQRSLSGAQDEASWLAIQQPPLSRIDLPCLLINSRDDPVLVWDNAADHLDAIRSNPNLALAEFRRGAHGCKFDFLGWHSIGHEIIGEFLDACCRELEQSDVDGDHRS